MTTTVAHDLRGRFASQWRDDQLLDTLAAVARHVDALYPTTVTTTAWDRSRGRALGLVDERAFPPTARAVVLRLNSRGRRRTWTRWLESRSPKARSVRRHSPRSDASSTLAFPAPSASTTPPTASPLVSACAR